MIVEAQMSSSSSDYDEQDEFLPLFVTGLTQRPENEEKIIFQSEEEKHVYKKKIEQIKQEQELRKLLKKVRDYQQAKICETLRVLRATSGDIFPEKHLE